jgi:hypothetical protein
MNYSSKLVAPLLAHWENYGVAGEKYVLGHCGIELYPQLFSKLCKGASKASIRKKNHCTLVKNFELQGTRVSCKC